MRTRTLRRPPGRVQPLVTLIRALPSGIAAAGGAGGAGRGGGGIGSQTSVRALSELQPLPICSRWPVTKPPRPLPRYMNSAPVGVAGDEVLPAVAAEVPAAEERGEALPAGADLLALAGDEAAAAVAAVHEQQPVAIAGEDVRLAVAAPVARREQRGERSPAGADLLALAGDEAAAAVAAVHEERAVGVAREQVGLAVAVPVARGEQRGERLPAAGADRLGLAGEKPPRSLPRYISSAPSEVRASRSGLPSPLQSPGASSAVKDPQPVPIVSPPPGTKAPAPVPRYISSRPSGSTASTSAFVSPLQSARADAAPTQRKSAAAARARARTNGGRSRTALRHSPRARPWSTTRPCGGPARRRRGRR